MHMSLLRRRLLAAALACAAVPALGADDADDAPAWRQIRDSVFGGREIETGAGVPVSLEMPARAEDAATVPVSIRVDRPQTPDAYVKKLYLVIDRNPSPLGIVFELAPETGRAEIETRVRIEQYTRVRAIAETSDGRLWMTSRFVKASGGCSAPAGKDRDAALARLGRMKLKVDGPVAAGRPAAAQLMISHPNDSGMAMDQVTRLYTPAHFVRRVEVSYAGRRLLTADVDFSISENPNFRFWFVPTGEGELRARAVDTSDLTFETSLVVRPGG